MWTPGASSPQPDTHSNRNCSQVWTPGGRSPQPGSHFYRNYPQVVDTRWEFASAGPTLYRHHGHQAVREPGPNPWTPGESQPQPGPTLHRHHGHQARVSLSRDPSLRAQASSLPGTSALLPTGQATQSTRDAQRDWQPKACMHASHHGFIPTPQSALSGHERRLKPD